jgi:hypothetical protein
MKWDVLVQRNASLYRIDTLGLVSNSSLYLE